MGGGAVTVVNAEDVEWSQLVAVAADTAPAVRNMQQEKYAYFYRDYSQLVAVAADTAPRR